MPRLPSAIDVPSVRVPSDPGLNVPAKAFESPLSTAAQEISEPLRLAAERMQSREDAIEFARAVEGVTKKSDNEVKKFNTERDLSDKTVSAELGNNLMTFQNEALTNFKGSSDARARLEARLIGIQSAYIGQAAEISSTISLKRSEAALDSALMPIVGQASQAASTLGVNGSDIYTLRKKIDEANLIWDSRIDDYRGLFDPTREDHIKNTGRSQIAVSTLNTLISRGNDDIAEHLLATGLSASLTPQQNQSITQKIADIRQSKTEMSTKIAQTETILGRQLSPAERGRLIGLDQGFLKMQQLENVKGSPLTWEEKKAVFGLAEAKPLVTIQNIGETSRAKAEGEAMAKITTEQLPSLRKQIGQIGAMEALLVSGLQTGKLSEFKLNAANFFGVDPKSFGSDANLASFRAVANSAVLTKSSELKGATSDRDITFIKDSISTAGSGPEANKATLRIARKLVERERDTLQEMDRYHTARGTLQGFEEYLKHWANENPLFSQQEMEQLGKGMRHEGQKMTGKKEAGKTAQKTPPKGIPSDYRYLCQSKNDGEIWEAPDKKRRLEWKPGD